MIDTMYHNKCLVYSSCLFIIPSIYAYYTDHYFYSVLLFSTSAISVNYWRDATYGWRRNLDLIFAKVSFGVFVSNGIMTVRNIPDMMIGYLLLVLCIYFYYLSSISWKIQNVHWYKYHILFHVCIMCEQMIIIRNTKTL